MGPHRAIAEGFLAAAVEPERWLGVLADTAIATGSDHAQVIGLGADYGAGFNWVNGFGADAVRAFDAIDQGSPLVSYRVAASVAARPGSLVHEAHYAEVRDTLVTDAYLDLVRDTDIPYGCQTDLRRDENGLLGFALLRSERTGPTTAEVRATFAELRGHAIAATELQIALERDGHLLVAGSFEAMGTACFVLDRALCVGAMTTPAEHLLREGVVRLVDARIGLPGAADERRLTQAMHALASGRSLAGHVVVSDGAGVMTLKLHRLPTRDWNMGFSPAAILVVKRSDHVGAIDVAVLRDTYRLTGAEAAIALLILAGRPRDAICAARGITRETLRTHLRALFAKLGVTREVEAIHLLHAVLG